MNAPSADSVRMEIQSRPDLLAPVRSMVISLAERFGFDEVECGHLALAVDEALANVIRHAYDNEPDHRIWITISPLETPSRVFRIVIEDEGRQCDLDKIASRDLTEIRPGGLGVHLMREVTDQCRFEHRTPRGTRLLLEKIPSAPRSRPLSPSQSHDENGTDSGPSHRHRN